MRIPIFLRKTGAIVSKNSPAILTGVSILSFGGTIIFAIKDSRKADLIVDGLRTEYAEKFDNKEIESSKIPVKVMLKEVAPIYLPTILMGLITVSCIVGASAISSKRNAVLASLYSASEMAMKEYQSKVVEKIGEKKEQEVRDDIDRDHISRNPVNNSQVIVTGRGDTLCYDKLSGRYFRSDIEKLRRLENQINKSIISYMFVSLNEVYEEMGLEGIELGEGQGWDVDHPLEFRFSAQLADNGDPCIVVGYATEPRYRGLGY